MLTISWGSVASRSETLWSKILFTVVPEELLIKGVTDEMLYEILVWSLELIHKGVWPEKDHEGKPWQKGTRRQIMAGRRLAGDFFGAFSEYRGDWEWTVETFQWRSTRKYQLHRFRGSAAAQDFGVRATNPAPPAPPTLRPKIQTPQIPHEVTLVSGADFW